MLRQTRSTNEQKAGCVSRTTSHTGLQSGSQAQTTHMHHENIQKHIVKSRKARIGDIPIACSPCGFSPGCLFWPWTQRFPEVVMGGHVCFPSLTSSTANASRPVRHH